MCDSFFIISNGPYLLGLSLAVGCVIFRCVAFSQTFCPSSNGLCLVTLVIICWVCVITCCITCVMALVWASLKLMASAREWAFLTCTYCMCPMINLKGALPIKYL